MVYEFAAKIKDIKNNDIMEASSLDNYITEINKHTEQPLDVKIMLSEKRPATDLLVKADISVTSLAGFHEDELTKAINYFKSFIEALAKAINGEVSKTEGFYHNNTTFNRLYT